MSPRRHFMTVAAVVVAILGLGGALLVWPNWRETGRVVRHTAALEQRIEELSDRREMLVELREQVRTVQHTLDEELHAIPVQPDHAQLIRRLSMPMDGFRVIDQTFTRGRGADAVPGRPGLGQVMPLTVDMTATFDAIFELIVRAEQSESLVRVSSVRLACEREEDLELPIVQASIVLEAVFEAEFDEEHEGENDT